MSNERTALLIIAGLVLAFVIAIWERLQSPLREMSQASGGDQVANFVYMAILAGIFASWFLYSGSQPMAQKLRSLAIWGGIAVVLTLIVMSFGPSGGSGTLSP